MRRAPCSFHSQHSNRVHTGYRPLTPISCSLRGSNCQLNCSGANGKSNHASIHKKESAEREEVPIRGAIICESCMLHASGFTLLLSPNSPMSPSYLIFLPLELIYREFCGQTHLSSCLGLCSNFASYADSSRPNLEVRGCLVSAASKIRTLLLSLFWCFPSSCFFVSLWNSQFFLHECSFLCS